MINEPIETNKKYRKRRKEKKREGTYIKGEKGSGKKNLQNFLKKNRYILKITQALDGFFTKEELSAGNCIEAEGRELLRQDVFDGIRCKSLSLTKYIH